jgi:pimeloyl-ACP methyl ester carboxylesterase
MVNSQLKTIYCISGLGADEKAFAKIKVKDCELHHLHWLTPHKNEPIADYAKRMAEQIKEPNPVLMGLSFGGIMCIEIAKLIPVNKVILVSSIPTSKQLPLWMKAAGLLRLHRMVPLNPHTKLLQPLQDFFIGAKGDKEKEIVRRYRQQVQQDYLKWAINAILKWKNDWKPRHLYHIHGDADRIFPFKKVHPDCIVKGGTHFMILSRAKEVNEYLSGIAV